MVVIGIALFLCMAGGLGRPATSRAGNLPALSVNSGVTINGYLNDQYVWYDSKGYTRSVALSVDNSIGGVATQFTYTPVVGSVASSAVTVNPNPGGGEAGFGYVVGHLGISDWAYYKGNGADDSPLVPGGNGATLFAGTNHAIHQYTLNYPRYGMTQAAALAYQKEYYPWTGTPDLIDPWYDNFWENGGFSDPMLQYITLYNNVPVTIQWMFATGRDYAIYAVTFDLSQVPDYAVWGDFRAPYGDMCIEGVSCSEAVGGVGWGDSNVFLSSTTPFSMNSAWSYSQANNGAPYNYLWTSGTKAEMGLAGTWVNSLQNAGGYSNNGGTQYANGKSDDSLRGQTSTTMGQCTSDSFSHLMPCVSDWAYQSINYASSSADAQIYDKKLAWGADWGSLGYKSLQDSGIAAIAGNTAISGWPKVSYSVYVVLDNHANNPTQTMASQAQTISLTSLTSSVGTVLGSGPAGVGRSDTMTYQPGGYSPIFGTWEVNASDSQATLTFKVGATAPAALKTPVIVLHHYTQPTGPTAIKYDGTTLANGADYFLSLNPDQVQACQSELWITLNKQLAAGTSHTVQIQNPVTAAPAASFTANPTMGHVPFTVQFTDHSTGSPTSWNWNFGDGSTSNLQNPKHTFRNAWPYDVELTVTNGGGCNSTVGAITGLKHVNSAPINLLLLP